MKKLVSLSVIAFVLVVLTSCTTTKLGGFQMSSKVPSFDVVGDFDTTIVVTKWLGQAGGATLFNMGADAASDPVFDAVQREINKVGGDGAVNIEITYGATFIQMLLNGFTGSLYAPANVQITGTVVKY